MNFKTLVGLIFCNLIWSFHPVMSKQILAEFSPPETALLRYGSAFLAFLLLWPLFGIKRPFFVPNKVSDRLWLAVLGLCTFTLAPFLQMTGIQISLATDSSIITAMEPLMAVFLAWIFLGEKLRWPNAIAFGFALTGFGFLSNIGSKTVSDGFDPRLIGNLLLLGSAITEGVYSVIGRKLVATERPVSLFATSLLVGVLTLGAAVAWVEPGGLRGVSPWVLFNASPQTLGAILFIGPLGTCIAYLYWMLALKRATVATLAVTLFIQPLCGGLWGYLFMGDRLSAIQAFGGLLILLGVLLPVLIFNLMKKN